MLPQVIKFHDQKIVALIKNDLPFVAMKPICENIGLDWDGQRQRIKRHRILNRGTVMITAPSKSGEQQYLCLPLTMLNGWLFGIDINRVKPELRDRLEQYQLECFDVLFKHFMPKANHGLSPEHQRHIQKRVAELAKQAGNSYKSVYGAIKDEFKVGTYKDIADSNYPALCEFLDCKPIDGEYIPNQLVPTTIVNKESLEGFIHHAEMAEQILANSQIHELILKLGNNTVYEAYQHLFHSLRLAYALNVGIDHTH